MHGESEHPGRPGNGGSHSPSSFVVFGPNRAHLDRLAWAIAVSVGPEVHWFDLRGPGDPLTEEERSVLERVDPSRAYRIAPEEAAPNDALGNLSLWTLLRDPSSSPEVQALSSYLRFPDAVRQVLDSRSPTDDPAAVVVANTDRGSAYYTGAAGEFRPILTVLSRLGITGIFTTGRTPRPNSEDFPYILRVIESPPGPEVAVLRAPPEPDYPFREGSRRPLVDVETELAPLHPRSTRRAA